MNKCRFLTFEFKRIDSIVMNAIWDVFKEQKYVICLVSDELARVCVSLILSLYVHAHTHAHTHT